MAVQTGNSSLRNRRRSSEPEGGDETKAAAAATMSGGHPASGSSSASAKKGPSSSSTSDVHNPAAAVAAVDSASISSSSDNEGSEVDEDDHLIPSAPNTTIGKTYTPTTDFTWMNNEEPHRARRTEILRKYPEIKALYGHEWRTKYMVGATVALQTYLAVALRDASWPVFILVAYVVGATANHSLFLAIHEWSHNLGFRLPLHNQIGSIFANLPIGIPYSASFKPYHMDHHRNQGVDGLDTDIAHPVEAAVIRNRTPLKALYMLLQLAFYALRPTLIKPLAPTKMMAANALVQITYDLTLLYFFGFNSLLYLLLSTFLCGSFHPTAGHFLSEHLEVHEGVETYSYYGILNYVTYNVGYHNEHHDFPFVAWSKLPAVKSIASEYYDPLPRCESWVGIIWNYVTNPNLGAYSRVKRTHRVSAIERVNPNDGRGEGTERDGLKVKAS